MKRRLPLIFVAVIAVICLVAASVAAVASGVSGSAVAYSVNGTKVSQATVDHELKWLASNSQVKKSLAQQGGTVSDSAIDSGFTASWLSQRIQVELLRQTAAEKGVTVPAKARKALAKQVTKRFPHAPESAREVLVDQNVYLNALGATTQQQQSDLLTAALKGAEIKVDPRYGRWNPRQGVCAPTGCPAASSNG
jgi:hypothetical protein